MNCLLDTHAFLWALFEHQKLSGAASAAILNADNEICISVISFWEIGIKFNLGKLSLQGVAPEELPTYAGKAGFEILGITPDDAASFYKLPKFRHSDPFDRLIIWQCIKNNICLITKDDDIKDYTEHGLKTIW